jgi:hypothetical protein
MDERITQEFRGARCKARMAEWERAMEAQGFRRESFSGWSGPGAYKHGSLTMVRPERTPALAGVGAGGPHYCPQCGVLHG